VNTTTVTILFCYLLITTYCVSYCCPKRALNYLDLLCEQNNCYNITLLPFGYLQVCFMLLHKKSTKPFRASNANTAIVTILLCYLLILQVCFMLLHKKSTKLFRASYVDTTTVTILLCYLLVLQVCFMLFHRKNTKLFRASYVNTTTVTILLCYLLVTSKFVSCCCTKRALNHLELTM
jgi:cytochrome bd-type quinol oxidase subunit 2